MENSKENSSLNLPEPQFVSLKQSLEDSLAKFYSAPACYTGMVPDDSSQKDKENKENCVIKNETTKPMCAVPFRVLPSARYKLNTYSKKVFVGGLPPDISADEISTQFSSFGNHKVDWPHKTQLDLFPPKGYAFLLFAHEESIHRLLEACEEDDKKYFFQVSSVSIKNKKVQVRPWLLDYCDCFLKPSEPLDPRKTVFVGGVPRLLKAQELAKIMNVNFDFVCYAGIDVDPWLKYPKGSARVCFCNQESYIKALQTRFVLLKTTEINKQVELKPFVLCNQSCDMCCINFDSKAPIKESIYFCSNVSCLKYFCVNCWSISHAVTKHRPIVINQSTTVTQQVERVPPFQVRNY